MVIQLQKRMLCTQNIYITSFKTNIIVSRIITCTVERKYLYGNSMTEKNVMYTGHLHHFKIELTQLFTESLHPSVVKSGQS